MFFGLAGAPATFQSAMNLTLQFVLRCYALVFFDDILVYSKNLAEHIQHVREVLSLLQRDNWNIKKAKCSFAQCSLSYSRFIISEQGVAMEPDKIARVNLWPVPRNVKDLRKFMGFAGYYRKFVQFYGILAKSLTDLLGKNTPFF